MIPAALTDIVDEIKKKEKEFQITPRELVKAFGFERRSKHNQSEINKFLEENQLEVEPSYINSWVDGKITLRHKEKAKSKNDSDPVQRLGLLPAANQAPETVKQDAKISEAITVMMMKGFSQLPVVSGPRDVIGLISLEEIGCRLANGETSKKVGDFVKKELTILDYDTPLLEAISVVIREGVVLVKKTSDKSLCGIVTIADISSQFFMLSEPFLYLEQIENHIRRLLNGKFLLKDIQELSLDKTRKVSSIDDLNFGAYVRLIENPDHWEKLKLTIDRKIFMGELAAVRSIRNDIMHFDPEGITDNQRESLRRVADFLTKITSYHTKG